MSKVEEIKAQIDALSEDERVILWDWILGDEDPVDPEWDAECAEIANERRKAVREGRSKLRTGEEVKQRIREEFGVEL